MRNLVRRSAKVRPSFQDELQEVTSRMNKFIELHDQLMIERTNEERHRYKSSELDKQIDSLIEETKLLDELLEKESALMDESEYVNSKSMIENIRSILRATKRKISEGIVGVGITKNSGHFGIEKTFAGNVFTGIFLVGAGYFVYNCMKKTK